MYHMTTCGVNSQRKALNVYFLSKRDIEHKVYTVCTCKKLLMSMDIHPTFVYP